MLQFSRGGTAALAVALLSASATLVSAQTAEKAGLSLKLEQGAKSNYALSWDLDLGQSINAGGQNMDLATFQIQVGYTLDQEITAVEDGVATVKATFKTVRGAVSVLAMGMPGPAENYDSEKEGGSAMLASLGKAIGESFTYRLTTRGKVSDVKGTDELTEKLTKAMQEAAQQGGGQPPNPMGMGPEQMAAMTLLAFQAESIESALNLLHYVLPEGEGESWTIDQEQKTKIGKMTFTGAYRLGEPAAGKTRVSFKNKDDVALQSGANEGPGLARMIQDLKVVGSKVKGLVTLSEGAVLDSEVEFGCDAEGTAPEMLKKRLEMMMGGGQGGDMKLGLKYGLKLRLERGGAAKKSEF